MILMRFFIWYLHHDTMFAANSAWCALIAQGLVQFGGVDFENWLTKLTCEKSREAFCTLIASQMLKIQREDSHTTCGCFA